MDEDGYLYITGRSKDVINRGGEIISPAEVENAVVAHDAIEAALAFSVPHDVLQVRIPLSHALWHRIILRGDCTYRHKSAQI